MVCWGLSMEMVYFILQFHKLFLLIFFVKKKLFKNLILSRIVLIHTNGFFRECLFWKRWFLGLELFSALVDSFPYHWLFSATRGMEINQLVLRKSLNQRNFLSRKDTLLHLYFFHNKKGIHNGVKMKCFKTNIYH